MSNNRILLLCNNIIAIPAIRELLFYDQVAAVVVPAVNKELITTVGEVVTTAVPIIKVDRKNFVSLISQTIREKEVVAVVMMTFPYMIPEELLSLPPKGFINFHYGRLPQYRGPEPIFAQVKEQEKDPGLSVHVVTTGIDDGPIILQEGFPYSADDTYGMLRQKLAALGAKHINLLMKILTFGKLVPAIPQDETLAVYHQKPEAKDLMINWQKMDSHSIKALVNACNPWNKGCGATIKEQVIGITEVEIMDNLGDQPVPAGTIVQLDKEKGLLVATMDNKLLKLNIVYTEEGFISGHKLVNTGIQSGDCFSS